MIEYYMIVFSDLSTFQKAAGDVTISLFLFLGRGDDSHSIFVMLCTHILLGLWLIAGAVTPGTSVVKIK